MEQGTGFSVTELEMMEILRDEMLDLPSELSPFPFDVASDQEYALRSFSFPFPFSFPKEETPPPFFCYPPFDPFHPTYATPLSRYPSDPSRGGSSHAPFRSHGRSSPSREDDNPFSSGYVPFLPTDSLSGPSSGRGVDASVSLPSVSSPIFSVYDRLPHSSPFRYSPREELPFGSRSEGPYATLDPVPILPRHENPLDRDDELAGDEDSSHASRGRGNRFGGRGSVETERIRRGSDILSEQARNRKDQSRSDGKRVIKRVDPETRYAEMKRLFGDPEEERVSRMKREWKPVYEEEVKRRYNERKRYDRRYKRDLMEEIEEGVIARGGKRGSLYHEYTVEESVIRDKAIDIVKEMMELMAASHSHSLSPFHISYPFSIPSNAYEESEMKGVIGFIERDLKAMRRG